MPSIWVSDEDYKALIDIKADLERYHKKPASFSDVVSHLMVKKRMLGGKSGKEIKNTRRAIRAKALTAAISALMLLSLMSVFQVAPVSAQGPQTLEVFGPITQLTIDNGHYLGSFSPDGSKIVYTATDGIYIMNADGTGKTKVGSISGGRPKWTPDGRISYAVGNDLRVCNPDGSGVITVVTLDGWARDGATTSGVHSHDWIEVDGTVKLAVASSSGVSTIYAADVNFEALPLEEENFVRITDGSTTAYAPAWSPDATEIACAWGPSTDMYVGVFKSDGSQTTPLRTIGAGGRYGGDYPDWGSNGKIVYSVGDAKQLYVMDSDGTDNVKISDGPAVMAAWSSDCKKLVYIDGFANKNIFTLSYPYATIQSAIDAASPGDTINVAAGAYNETVKLKSTTATGISIVGHNKTTTFITGGICFEASYSGLKVQNFTISGNGFLDTETYEATVACWWKAGHVPVTNLEFSDCIFDGEGYDDGKSGRCGVVLKKLGGVVKFENNEFKNYRGWATLDVNDEGQPVTSYTFNNNNVHNNWGSCALRGNPSDRTDTVTVDGNTFDNNGNPNASFWAALEINEADSVTVSNNTITNTQSGSWGEGEALQFWHITTLNVTGNTIANNYQGIYFAGPAPWAGDVSGAHIHFNNIYGNTQFGIKVETGNTGTVDAENNWWGDPTGPRNPTTNSSATGDDVSDNVDYTPWLDAPHPDGKARSWNAQNVNTGKNFNSIQEAIDNASEGETVLVGPGTYDEYVDIDKPLTLSGQSGAIVKPTSPAGTIISIQADDVTVEGFEVDGSSGGGAICAGIGSIHWTPDGTTKWNGYKNITIRNNTVHDIQNDTDKGLGITLWRNDGHTYENILIEGNTVYNTGRMGIYIGAIKFDYSEWLLSASNTIKGNVVHDTMLNPNAGETFPGGCGGIALDAAKDCTIEGNTVYNSGTSDNPMPGIFLAHGSAAGNQILGNEVYNQAYGIAVEIDRGDVVFDGDPPATPEVHYNNIHNNDQYGLIVLNAAGEVVDATLNWWGDPSGPSGVGLGSGDAVSANVDYRPWLDAPYQIGEVRSSNVLNESTGAEFDTIQAAINVASSGDTVLVYPGTYNGDIRIGKALTVKSTDGAEKTIIDGVGSYIVIISHSDVTFEGFTVKNPEYTGGADASGILVETVTESVNNVQILNNIVTQVRSETGTPSTFGATGINIGNAPLSNVVVSGNTIENIKNPEGGASDHTCGINVWDGAENVLISNNAISDIKYNGIMLEYASNVRIENNAITECEVGIRVEPYEGVTVSDLTINYNNIVGNREYGVLNTMIDFIDATLNWWGDPGGPGADEDGNSVYGDNVSANVNYDPWLPRPLPTISDISVSGVTTTSATITWTTALPADSRVEYGPTIAYGLTSSIPDLTTSHSLGLTGLTPSTTYHFRVRSEDAYGHVDNSGDLTFITAAPPPPATLTVDTTPIKANVYVDGSLLGVALRTRSLAAGTYTISFGDVLGYLTPAPEIVTLAAGETRTVEGVYTEIPPENIENQSPTYDLPSITPDENATIPVENSALTEITIQVKNAAENVKITVQEVTEGAAGIAIGAPGATYKYLNIVAENITDAQIESVVIRFKVEKSWIIANDIDIATITLNHYDPLTGEWTSLPTTYLSEDDTYVYFSAISPGLSIFGVSGSTTIPANFELSNLVITPSEVNVGETVTISVVVNNAGGRTESTTVTLEINGAAVDTQSTTLDAGESTTVTFTVSEDVADTYTVNVAGLTGSFVVTAPPAPPIVPLAVSIIIIVLAIGIVLWLRRIG